MNDRWKIEKHPATKDKRFFIPLRIYGDGADAQQPFEIYTVLPVLGAENSSTLDTRLLVAVRNTFKTHDSCRDDILTVIAWSFEALSAFLKIRNV